MKPCFLHLPLFVLLSFFACKDKEAGPSPLLIKEMSLKKGELVSCGPAGQQLGAVVFRISGPEKANEDFALGLKLLHSFEYDEAEKVFARIIDEYPDCAMAYWGVAMSNFHPLWDPPSEAELKKGSKAIEIARTIEKTEKEADYIEAIASFYTRWKATAHRTRCLYFEKAMEKLHTKYPTDKEAAIFYALALNAAADPTDKSFAKQKKAGRILNALYPGDSNHPGIIHYIIHTYDYPELAEMALPAARKYASVAPSSAHALHMPSHIFTRLGLWDECIHSNLASVSSAQCYARQTGIKGHWDEELHGMDYLAYAYLQKGDNERARKQWDYLKSIDKVHPANFKVAYAFAAIPARYVLENRLWKEAAELSLPAGNLAWKDFAWQEAILHFARVMGALHNNNTTDAEVEWKALKRLHRTLLEQKDAYKAGQVEIQIKTAEAWMQLQKGNKNEALRLMHSAADMEDHTEKHPVTPGEVLPARELLGDMYLSMNQWSEALQAYESSLQKHPNRFNGLYGAGLAAEKGGQLEKAGSYYRQLLKVVNNAPSDRSELKAAKLFLEKQKGRKTA